MQKKKLNFEKQSCFLLLFFFFLQELFVLAASSTQGTEESLAKLDCQKGNKASDKKCAEHVKLDKDIRKLTALVLGLVKSFFPGKNANPWYCFSFFYCFFFYDACLKCCISCIVAMIIITFPRILIDSVITNFSTNLIEILEHIRAINSKLSPAEIKKKSLWLNSAIRYTAVNF